MFALGVIVFRSSAEDLDKTRHGDKTVEGNLAKGDKRSGSPGPTRLNLCMYGRYIDKIPSYWRNR